MSGNISSEIFGFMKNFHPERRSEINDEFYFIFDEVLELRMAHAEVLINKKMECSIYSPVLAAARELVDFDKAIFNTAHLASARALLTYVYAVMPEKFQDISAILQPIFDIGELNKEYMKIERKENHFILACEFMEREVIEYAYS